MAWTAPSTFVAGAILTAAQLNTNVRDNSLAGGPIYATEALRDAAITSPFEGQRAYITGSTETTAAGGSTQIPTGIQTIYNGSGWVTVTPTGAYTGDAGTTALTSFSSVLTGSPGTAPTVTTRTGTTALVSFSVVALPSTNNAVYVTIGTSATAGGNLQWGGLFQYGASPSQCLIAGTAVMTGLSSGLNTFYLQYSVSSGSSSISVRRMNVQGIA